MSDAQLTARSLETLLGEWRGARCALPGAGRPHPPAGARRPHPDRHAAARRARPGRAARPQPDHGHGRVPRAARGGIRRQRARFGQRDAPARARCSPCRRRSGATGCSTSPRRRCPPHPPCRPPPVPPPKTCPHFLPDSGYDPVGLPHLREAIAERYRQRGLPTEPDQILVTVGAQQAIALIARTFLARGDRALIEMPTYPHATEALRLAGARLVPITVTPPGADGPHPVARRSGRVGCGRDRAGHRAGPTRRWRTSSRTSTTRPAPPCPRRHAERVLAAAAAHGHDRGRRRDDRRARHRPARGVPPAAALRARAAPGDAPVILIGSASKTLWGGLRIGWIRAERPLIQRLIAAKPATDLGTPMLEQLVVARMLPELAGDPGGAARAAARRPGHGAPRSRRSVFPDWTRPAAARRPRGLGRDRCAGQLGARARRAQPRAAHRGRSALRARRRVRALPAHPDHVHGGRDGARVRRAVARLADGARREPSSFVETASLGNVV